MKLQGYKDGIPVYMEAEASTLFGSSKIVLVLPDGIKVEGEGVSYFEALNPIRQRLELIGILLSVNATRLDAIVLPSGGYSSDRVSIVEAKKILEVDALLPAALNKVGTLQQQADTKPELLRRIEMQVNSAKKAEENKVTVTNIRSTRVKYGLFFSLFTFIFPILPILLLSSRLQSLEAVKLSNLLATANNAFLTLAISAAVFIILWATSVTQCITEIARTISTSARIGLIICLTLPITWTLTIVLFVKIVTFIPKGWLN